MKSELENKKKLHHSKQKVQRQSFQEEEDIQQRVSVWLSICSLKG